MIDMLVGVEKHPLATSVAFLIALISIFCLMSAVNGEEVVNSVHGHDLVLSLLSLQST